MKTDHSSRRVRFFSAAFITVLIGIVNVLYAAEVSNENVSATAGTWWEGRNATGTWLGVRDKLDDEGVEINGSWKGTFYGLTSGGLNSPHGAFDEELTLGITLDFGKLAGIEGLKALGAVRYRDGRSPNEYVGASTTFNPSRYQSGQQWRLMPFFLSYTTPTLFGVKDFLTISGGWQNPYSFFADQPDSKLFTTTMRSERPKASAE